MTDRFPGLKFLVFAILCSVAAAWLVSVTGNLKRLPFFNDLVGYEVELTDASGLSVGDDVRLAGVAVGRVERITLERGRALVNFVVEPQVEITTSWEVGARWRNVIGQRYLYLYDIPGGSQLDEGDRIPAERARPVADIGRFFNEITPFLRALDPEQQNKLLDALNEVIVGNEDRIQELVVDLGSLSSTVADQDAEIRTVLQQGNAFLGTYNERQSELQAFLTNLADVGSVLRVRNDELLGAVNDITEVQQHFGDLLRTNDAEIREVVDNVEFVTDTIGRNRAEFEEAVASTRAGLAVYMLISRWGQWFNVRAVAIQVQDNGQVVYCQTEASNTCSIPNSRPQSAAADASRGSAGRSLAAVQLVPTRLDPVDVIAGAALDDPSRLGLARAGDLAAVLEASP